MYSIAVNPDGIVRCIYDDALLPVFEALGTPHITRASCVEPYYGGGWFADMSTIGGSLLGPYRLRSDALAVEVQWLRDNLNL